MATIILGVIGNYLAPGIGGQIGVSLGAYIDSAYVLPALFNPDPNPGQKINDFGLSGLSPGDSIPIAIGEYCRFPGQYIWVSDVRVYEVSSGGKHSGGQQTSVWKYSADVGIACGIGPYEGLANKVDDLSKVFADNQCIYNTDDPPIYRTNLFELEAGYSTRDDGNGNITIYARNLTVHEATSGCDLSVFRVGAMVITYYFGTGSQHYPAVYLPTFPNLYAYDNSPYDGFKVIDSGKRHPITNKSYVVLKQNSYSTRCGSTPLYGGTAALGSAFDPATITLLNPRIFSTDTMRSLTMYPGQGYEKVDSRQPIDPTIFASANKGTAQGHRFNGIAWLKIIDLALTPYGNRFPMFEVLTRERFRTYQSAISRLIGLARQPISSRLDVSKIEPRVMKGYVARGPSPLKQLIQPLAIAEEIVAQEDGDVVKLFNRHNAELVIIEDEDLGAAAPGEQQALPVRFFNTDESKVPTEVIVNFNDLNNDCQPGSARAISQSATRYVTNKIDLPITMGDDDAYRIAERVLWGAILSSKRVQIQLPFKYARIGENTKIQFNAFGQTWLAMVTKVDRSANTSAIEIEAEIENRAVQNSPYVNSPSAGGGTDRPGQDGPITNFTYFRPIDISGFFEDHLTEPGLYVPATRYSDQSGADASILRSEFNAEDYKIVRRASGSAILGVATDVLPSGPIGVWDTTSTLNIRLVRESLSLESRTEEEVANGANHGVIGNEIIAWQNATLESDGSWTLSMLLRGLRDTQDAVDLHIAGESFYQIDRNTCCFVQLPDLSAVGRMLDYKVVNAGGFIEDAEPYSFASQARNMRPFTPTNFTANAALNGWLLQWEPVSRSFLSPITDQMWSSLEEFESYRIEVFNDGDDPLVADPVFVKVVTDTQEYNLSQQDVLSGGINGVTTPFLVTVRQLGKAGLSKFARIDVAAGSGGGDTQIVQTTGYDQTLSLILFQ